MDCVKYVSMAARLVSKLTITTEPTVFELVGTTEDY